MTTKALEATDVGRGTKRRTAGADDTSKETKKPKKADASETEPESVRKYNPHIDGRGPSLDGCWREQISDTLIPDDYIKIALWNVNGLKSITSSHKNTHTAKGDLQAYLEIEKPTILCLNETKVGPAMAEKIVDDLPEYKVYFAHSAKAGYAGVGILIRRSANLKIEKVITGCGDKGLDCEGRTVAVVFPKVILVTTYVQNAGEGLKRLSLRIEKFDKHMHEYIVKLSQEYARPVIWTGDFNCAREEIDIWNSKANQRSPGHTKEERESLTSFLASGDWVDLWRAQNPDYRQYTFWPMRAPHSRTRNLGWRLDLFIVSKSLIEDCDRVYIRDRTKGSDHCPVLMAVRSCRFR